MDYASIIVASISFLGVVVGAILAVVGVIVVPLIQEYFKARTEERNRMEKSNLKANESKKTAYKNFIDTFSIPYNKDEGINAYIKAVNDVLMLDEFGLSEIPSGIEKGDTSGLILNGKIEDNIEITNLHQIQTALLNARGSEYKAEDLEKLLYNIANKFVPQATDIFRNLNETS